MIYLSSPMSTPLMQPRECESIPTCGKWARAFAALCRSPGVGDGGACPVGSDEKPSPLMDFWEDGPSAATRHRWRTWPPKAAAANKSWGRLWIDGASGDVGVEMSSSTRRKQMLPFPPSPIKGALWGISLRRCCCYLSRDHKHKRSLAALMTLYDP